MKETAMIDNVSSQATTADRIIGNLHLPPPRRTVRADFPHTAHRQSLVTWHSRGVEGVPPLQVKKSVAFQSRIQTFSLSKGPTPPLAPVHSLRLATQFPSQKRDFLRHPGFRLEPFCLPFPNGALLAQAVSPLLDRNMTEVRPLRSILFPGLLRYYEPLRLPTVAGFEVMDSPEPLDIPFRMSASSGLPGPSTDLSARALLNHPGRSRKCLRSLLPCEWLASSSLEGWPPPSQRIEAESGLLSLGLTPSLSGKILFPSSLCRDRPIPRLRLPSAGGRNYMLNEQLPCMTPFSHIDQPGLSWRTRVAEIAEGDFFCSNRETAIGAETPSLRE